MAAIEFKGRLGVAKIRQLIGEFDEIYRGKTDDIVLDFKGKVERSIAMISSCKVLNGSIDGQGFLIHRLRDMCFHG